MAAGCKPFSRHLHFSLTAEESVVPRRKTDHCDETTKHEAHRVCVRIATLFPGVIPTRGPCPAKPNSPTSRFEEIGGKKGSGFPAIPTSPGDNKAARPHAPASGLVGGLLNFALFNGLLPRLLPGKDLRSVLATPSFRTRIPPDCEAFRRSTQCDTIFRGFIFTQKY